ncbi:Pre-rRNA-processing protein TSR2-domain-containing protein [Xylaria sp. CBS 124048]|nr:Pre-rRNA-processing protein TSR2-domain-containing protein [Xylaria sp. CBS 124048]
MSFSFAEGPSPESRQQEFEQGVAISLHLWQSLSIAVQNSWGGPDSSDKRAWLAGVIVDMFPSFVDIAAAATSTSATTMPANPPSQNNTKTAQSQTKKLPEEPISEDIEDTLLQVMFDEFEANVDDQSEAQVADRIMKCRAQCAEGNFTLVEELRARWLDTKGKKVVAQAAADPDQDTDWDSGSDDEDDDGNDEDNNGDIDMEDAPALVPVAPKEKPQPEIDEDGFEKVTRKRR